MKRRGVTLLELLVSAILTAAIVSALAMAFSVAAKHQRAYAGPRESAEARIYLENRIRTLLSHASLNSDATDLVTLFRTDSDTQGSDGSDRLTFTVDGQKWNLAALDDTSTDFEARNESYGPVGGLTEVSLGTTPQGEAGSRTGLFVRTQTPADIDHEQGGYEQVLDDQVASLTFEVLDGSNWTVTWDTDTDRRLPTAVRVTYSLLSDPEVRHIFVVRLTNASAEGAQP